MTKRPGNDNNNDDGGSSRKNIERSNIIQHKLPKTTVRISRWNFVLVVATALGVGAIWAFQIFYVSYRTACQRRCDPSADASRTAATTTTSKGGDDVAGNASSDNEDYIRDLELSLFRMQGSIQRHSLARAVLEYPTTTTGGAASNQQRWKKKDKKKWGRDEPPPTFGVVFVVSIPDGDSNSSKHAQQQQQQADTIELEIELNQLYKMPHTVYTFLKLVDLGLYTGTMLQILVQSQDVEDSTSSTDRHGVVVLGGDPNDIAVEKSTKSQLVRRYAEEGFSSRSPYWIVEEEVVPEDLQAEVASSPSLSSSCSGQRGSFGIAQHGPEFVILPDADDFSVDQYAVASLSCPGRVVRGLDELVARLQELSKFSDDGGRQKQKQSTAAFATIVDARVLGKDGESDDAKQRQRDEL